MQKNALISPYFNICIDKRIYIGYNIRVGNQSRLPQINITKGKNKMSILDKKMNPKVSNPSETIGERIADVKTCHLDARACLPTLLAAQAAMERAAKEVENAKAEYDRASQLSKNYQVQQLFSWWLDTETLDEEIKSVQHAISDLTDELQKVNPTIVDVFDDIQNDADALELAEYIIEEGHGAHTSMQWSLQDVNYAKSIQKQLT